MWSSRRDRRICARERVLLTTVPPPSTIRSSPNEAFLKLYKKMETKIRRISQAWRARRFNKLKEYLDTCDDFLDPAKPHLLILFVGLGGICVFFQILCDPAVDPTPRDFMELASGSARTTFMQPSDIFRTEYTEVLLAVTRVLTELLICHSDFGWYFYDRYPGVFYRLLEFIGIPHLGYAASSMLEHLFSAVGPVMEIAKNPILIDLLRTKKDAAFVSVCRVVALLIVPGMSLAQSRMPSRRLPFPESLLPLKRAERVIDSNILWLLGEKGLVNRLITLCEVRAGGIRVQQGARIMTLNPVFMDPLGVAPPNDWGDMWSETMGLSRGGGAGPTGAPTMQSEAERVQLERLMQGILNGTDPRVGGNLGGEDDEWEEEEEEEGEEELEDAVPPLRPESRGNFANVLNAIGQALQNLSRPAATNRSPSSGSGNISSNNNNSANAGGSGSASRLNGQLSATMATPAERRDALNEATINSALNEAMTTAAVEPTRIIQQMMDEDLLQGAAMRDNFNSSVDFSWFLGSGDTRQRWHLRDPTLIQDRDDDRPYKCGYGMPSDAHAVAAFQEQNAASLKSIRPARDLVPGEYQLRQEQADERQFIVDSQSEILFLLNVMLSVFYFSDAWVQMRECRWLERANSIYDVAFGLDNASAALVEVPPHINISPELKKLPRFQPVPTVDETDGGSEESTPVALATSHKRRAEGGASCVVAATTSARYRRVRTIPAHWRLPSFWDMLGEENASYYRDGGGRCGSEEDEFADEKSHQHGTDTIRKLELLRGVQEFWGVQDRFECAMTQSEDIPQLAKPISTKIAATVAMNKEDSCVETAAFQTLEGYLRCFSFPLRAERCTMTGEAPQEVIAGVLMRCILEDRLYNATRIPGLCNSMAPAKRMDAIFAVLSEMMRYHYDNLCTLRRYVMDEVSLTHLNAVSENDNTNRINPVILSGSHEEAARILKAPPLDRQESEPFGRVLLRRVYRFGCDSNLLIRCLLLSTTPGLRSQHNYICKEAANMEAAVVGREDKEDALRPATSGTQASDVVTGYPVRLTFVRRVSRRYAARLSDEVEHCRRQSGEEEWSSAQTPSSVADILEEMMAALQRAPHRLPFGERPFPTLLDASDLRILRGEASLPLFGAPEPWRLPLFGSRISDAAGLEHLACFNDYLLSEPHKLVYGMLSAINADNVTSTGRLCVLTTVVLFFVREAYLSAKAGRSQEEAVRDILTDLKPLAEEGHRRWQERCAKKQQQSRHGETAEGEGKHCGTTSVLSICTCPREKWEYGSNCCSTFSMLGSCNPPNDFSTYYETYGGCFYRNMFRLLCLWVSHYWACQRYVETLFFCTEVAFAEYKAMVMHLFSQLPKYFVALPAKVEAPSA